MTLYNLETGTDGARFEHWLYPRQMYHAGGWDPACALCNPTMAPDPLHVDEETWPWATVEDDRRSGGAIVWMLAAIVAALLVAAAFLLGRMTA